MKVVDIDYNNHNLFDKLVKKNYNFVKFYHPDCHYCKAMSNTWNTLPSVLYWLLFKISIRQGNSELATPSVKSFSMSSRLYPCETAA